LLKEIYYKSVSISATYFPTSVNLKGGWISEYFFQLVSSSKKKLNEIGILNFSFFKLKWKVEDTAGAYLGF
jgi:hypothetical protein